MWFAYYLTDAVSYTRAECGKITAKVFLHTYYHLMVSPLQWLITQLTCVTLWKPLTDKTLFTVRYVAVSRVHSVNTFLSVIPFWKTSTLTWHLIRQAESLGHIRIHHYPCCFIKFRGFQRTSGPTLLHITRTQQIGLIMVKAISLNYSFYGVHLIRDTGSNITGVRELSGTWKRAGFREEKYRQPGLWWKARCHYHENRIFT